jgi:excisionase family DNA binding protein
MNSINSGVIGRGTGQDVFEPFAVSPRRACLLLDVGNTKLYALLAAGELESYRDGRSRKIVTASIRRRIARLLTEAGATGAAPQNTPPPRRRGRPRKIISTDVQTRLDVLTLDKTQP